MDISLINLQSGRDCGDWESKEPTLYTSLKLHRLLSSGFNEYLFTLPNKSTLGRCRAAELGLSEAFIQKEQPRRRD